MGSEAPPARQVATASSVEFEGVVRVDVAVDERSEHAEVTRALRETVWGERLQRALQTV